MRKDISRGKTLSFFILEGLLNELNFLSISKALKQFIYYFFQCIEAAKNRSTTHDGEDDNDLFTKSLQAKWFNSLTNTLCNDISTSWKNERGAFDPKVLVQKMIDVLKEESAAENMQVNDIFYQSLEELKTDPDFSKIMTEFDDAVNGKRNMMTVGMFGDECPYTGVCLVSVGGFFL